MIKVQQASKSFGSNPVLKNVNLAIEKGEIVTIIGPSGTGKTTLLRCINFLEHAESGIIEVDGIRVNCAHASGREILALRRKTAMVFQSYNMFRNKTVLQTVTEGLVVVKKWPAAKALQRAKEELERVGMLDKLASYPSQISGGQQQRVAIARAMALDPSIILFDEPTSALDPELSAEVLETIKKESGRGVTMLIVTHEIAFARDISRRIVFMDEGTVLESGTPLEMFTTPKNERTKQFVSRIAPLDFQI
jgi:L-cystine transport system ATP-binding protein